MGAHKRPTHDFWDPGRDSFLSLNGEKAIKAVADELFPASGSDPHGVWTHFPSKNVYTSPQRRTISTAMTLFANQPEVHGHVCPWVHEVVHTTSDLGLDALQLKDFTSKYTQRAPGTRTSMARGKPTRTSKAAASSSMASSMTSP